MPALPVYNITKRNEVYSKTVKKCDQQESHCEKDVKVVTKKWQ